MISDWLTSAVADPLLFGTKLLLAGSLLGLLANLINTRCRSLITQWAQRGGWDIVDCRRCLRGSEPLKLLPVYRVELASRSGRRREAYVRCGDLTWSVFSDELAVEWVESESR